MQLNRFDRFRLRWRSVRHLAFGLVGLVVFELQASGQQNLFNVPSGTVTRQEEVFLQEQLNIGPTGESNFTVDYGLGNDWEVGLNLLKLNLYPGDLPLLPEASARDALMFNIQKVFRPMETAAIEIGTQNGVSATNASQKVEFMDFTWGVGRWTPKESRFEGTLIFGTYYGNKAYLGQGNEFGWMAGIEYPIIEEKLGFVTDYISGVNDSSVAVIGGQWTLSPRNGWQISLGAQLPSPGSNNDYGAVFELTKFPPSFRKRIPGLE